IKKLARRLRRSARAGDPRQGQVAPDDKSAMVSYIDRAVITPDGGCILTGWTSVHPASDGTSLEVIAPGQLPVAVQLLSGEDRRPDVAEHLRKTYAMTPETDRL